MELAPSTAAVSQSAAEPAHRVPVEPYPGLRPFLDHEAALLLGRAGQVREVIDRLAQTRFVAVIGGSGCGKSSLIRAGVVPRLRTAAIAEAGGYWVPVVCTPGTTPASPGAAGSTPLTRLAWKFSQMLAPLDEPQAAQRRQEMAEVFRRGAGFARLADLYHDELPAQGPDTAQARFLFVIDQFEELFHPNNHDNADARLLVEAVIAHFFNPHPRVYVVTTMRSEHLADCAAYLDLPDAINRSMYLVRRLSQAELREVIVGPAQCFLRLRQRADRAQAAALPRSVAFDEAVLTRLIADVEAIVDDADHLPLLQHLLARLWCVACRREGVPPLGVPARITWEDLAHTALPAGLERPPTVTPALLADRPQVNTLRVCLDHWAQLRYEQHAGAARPAAERSRFDAMLRLLAYRDPDNGLYFQQRLSVADAGPLFGTAEAHRPLREMLAQGFLDEVNYLFWDTENPQAVTLKVSHEAFIRGWGHFRKLVDEEAARFEEFIVLLRRCADWQHDGRPSGLLLEGADLQRLRRDRLDTVLARPDERRDWFRVLRLCRDGQRLADVEPAIDAFIDASERLRLAEEHEAMASRRRWRGVLLGSVAVLGVTAAALVAAAVQMPAMAVVEGFAQARRTLESLGTNTADGTSPQRLERMLEAADALAQAQDVAGGRFFSSVLLLGRQRPNWPLIGDAARLVDLNDSEGLLNRHLRQALGAAIWPGDTGGPASSAPVQHRFEPRWQPVECRVPRMDGSADTPVLGAWLVDANPAPRAPLRRALFVPRRASDGEDIAFYVAPFDARHPDQCRAAPQPFWSVPAFVSPRVLVDAHLRYLALTTRRSDDPPATEPASPAASAVNIMLFALQWANDASGQPEGVEMQQVTVLSHPAAGALVEAEFAAAPAAGPGQDPSVTDRLRLVPSWREPAGLGLRVGGRDLHLFDEHAARLPEPGPVAHWATLTAAVPESPCGRLAQRLRPAAADGRGDQMLHTPDGRCLDVQRLPAGGGAWQGGGGGAPRERVVVTLYGPPGGSDAELVTPLAVLTAFERRTAPADGPDVWRLGVGGPFTGWLADVRGDPGTWWAAPLTTSALVQHATTRCRDGLRFLGTPPSARNPCGVPTPATPKDRPAHTAAANP